MQAEVIRIAADHPSLPGHFPGNPVVPGVVLMDEVAAVLERRQGGPVRIKAMPVVKFVSLLRADQEAHVIFTPVRPGLVKFECRVGAIAIANGSIELEPYVRRSSATP